MARVVVIGGGLGGCASAARLAKLGHEVTVLEALPGLGGAVGTVTQDGFSWDTGPAATALPAVLRDLFRKSGRPLERELELVPLQPLREHRFPDDVRVVLPSGSRAAQLQAVGEALGADAGREWVDYVHSFAPTWDLLRREAFERAYAADVAPSETRALLRSRQTLTGAASRRLRDPRLRAIATSYARSAGHDPRRVPAWWGLVDYLEQNFGTWTIVGGFGRLADRLGNRLAERRVEVRASTRALDIEMGSAGPVAVRTEAGRVPAQVVVVAVDPQRLPALTRWAGRGDVAPPPHVTHLGLRELPAEVGWKAGEVVLHHDGEHLTVRTTGQAPEGGAAWSLLYRPAGGLRRSGDPVLALVRAGVDIRPLIETRIDCSSRDLVEHYSGSPYGARWRGRRAWQRRLGPRTSLPGVYVAGAGVGAGGWLPFVGLTASVVAEELGKA